MNRINLEKKWGNALFQQCYVSKNKAYRGMESYSIKDIVRQDETISTVNFINKIYNQIKKYHDFNTTDGFYLTVNDLRYFLKGNSVDKDNFCGYVALGDVDIMTESNLEKIAYDRMTGYTYFDEKTISLVTDRNCAFRRELGSKKTVGPIVELNLFIEKMIENGYKFYNEKSEPINSITDLTQAEAVTIASKYSMKENKKEDAALAETFTKKLVKRK